MFSLELSKDEMDFLRKSFRPQATLATLDPSEKSLRQKIFDLPFEKEVLERTYAVPKTLEAQEAAIALFGFPRNQYVLVDNRYYVHKSVAK